MTGIGVATRPRFTVWMAVLSLIGLAAGPYLPFVALPHISDDYLQIELARDWGPVSGWAQLAADPLYRCRATSLILTHWTESLFGASPMVFAAESIALHVLATLMVAALGWWHRIGWRLSIPAAAFFAFYEGHQEAIVWHSALPELLVFCFGLAALHCWILWCERTAGGASLPFAGAFGFFVLALLSKESGVAVLGLLAGTAAWVRVPLRRSALGLAPFILASLVYAAAIFATKTTHLHFNDGTFSLGAPVVEVVGRSALRLLWFWGVLAVAVLLWRRKSHRWLLLAAAAWILVTLLPYSFLTYMPRVPSRHVYFASAGLAFLVGGAFLVVWDRPRSRSLAVAAAAAMVIHNVGWLWVKKYPQYDRRAEPTEALIRYANGVRDGLITVKCFPYGPEVAVRAVRVRLGKSIRTQWNPKAPDGDRVYCDPSQP